jgi:hypothetical protein
MKINKYFFYLFLLLSVDLKAQTYHPSEQVKNRLEATAGENIPESNIFFKINQIKQEPPKSWCQATCAAMLLSFMGEFHINAIDIEMGTTGCKKPAAMSQIVTFLNKNNVPFFAARFEPTQSSPELVLEYAKDICDQGSPSYILLNRHAYVIAGYNNKMREVYMINPLRDKQILVYTYDNFNKWVADSKDYTIVKKVFLAHKVSQPKRFSYVVETNAVSRLVLLK